MLSNESHGEEEIITPIQALKKTRRQNGGLLFFVGWRRVNVLSMFQERAREPRFYLSLSGPDLSRGSFACGSTI